MMIFFLQLQEDEREREREGDGICVREIKRDEKERNGGYIFFFFGSLEELRSGRMLFDLGVLFLRRLRTLCLEAADYAV